MATKTKQEYPMKIFNVTERRARGDGKDITYNNCESCLSSKREHHGVSCIKHGKTTGRGICADFQKHPDCP